MVSAHLHLCACQVDGSYDGLLSAHRRKGAPLLGQPVTGNLRNCAALQSMEGSSGRPRTESNTLASHAGMMLDDPATRLTEAGALHVPQTLFQSPRTPAATAEAPPGAPAAGSGRRHAASPATPHAALPRPSPQAPLPPAEGTGLSVSGQPRNTSVAAPVAACGSAATPREQTGTKVFQAALSNPSDLSASADGGRRGLPDVQCVASVLSGTGNCRAAHSYRGRPAGTGLACATP